MSHRQLTWIVLALCLVSRWLSTIYYIEDPDSLRFALSTVDYNVARLQPHFPGYPVFCWLVKLISTVTGSYAVAFSLVGGAATWIIILSVVHIADTRLSAPKGALLATLVFLNPLMWLMGNRYMPDLAGLACLLAAFYYLTRGRNPVLGGLLSGLLVGIRLSYLPFILVPTACALWYFTRDRVRYLGAGTFGVLVWLIPLVWLTGWEELLVAAQAQSAGHFTEFGGSVGTEPDVLLRVIKLVEGIFADGLGLYWADRHVLTAVALASLMAVILPSAIGAIEQVRNDWVFRIHLLSWVVYLVWIFLGQNVIHKSRHVMPLLPILLILIAQALTATVSRPTFRMAALVLFLGVHTYITGHLIVQHTRPSSIAQIKAYLGESFAPNVRIITVPLIEYYLSSQDVQATYIIIEDPSELDDLPPIPADAPIVAIGSPHAFPGRTLKARRAFYHNPYVNRMWPEIHIYEY